MGRPFPSPFDGFRRLTRRGGSVPPGPSPDAELEAFLTGKVGFARDPADLSTLWQDVAGTVPVTAAGQPVARWDGKFTSTPRRMTQATASFCPAYDGAGLAFDGTDDRLDTPTGLGEMSNGAPGYFTCVKARFNALPAQSTLHAFSAITSTNNRGWFGLLANGAAQFFGRRTDGDTQANLASSAGVLTTGVDYVISFEVDAAGTGNVRCWVNGALVLTGALAGSPGNFSSTTSPRVREGSNLGNTVGAFMNGWMRRRVDVAQAVSDADRAMIEAWVGAH